MAVKRKKKTAKQKLAVKCINLWKKKSVKDKCELCGGTWKLTGHQEIYYGLF